MENCVNKMETTGIKIKDYVWIRVGQPSGFNKYYNISGQVIGVALTSTGKDTHEVIYDVKPQATTAGHIWVRESEIVKVIG